jgi:hypothetical protein
VSSAGTSSTPLQQRGIAAPADFDAAEQIGLGARHLEQPLRLERGLGAENLGVGLEADGGAAPVVDFAEVFELALGMAALERASCRAFGARDLDLEPRDRALTTETPTPCRPPEVS